MTYLIIHVVFIALFSLCYKIAEKRQGSRPMVVLFAMAVAATLLSAGGMVASEGFVRDWRLIGLGILGGLFLFLAMYTFFRAMAQGGLAIGWTFVSLAVVIPVVASIWIWNEIPGPLQVAGLVLMIPCILLFGDLHLSVKGSPARWAVLVGLASVMTGLCQVTNKAAAFLPVVLRDGEAGNAVFNYMTWAFATGGLVALAGCRDALRNRPRTSEMTIGLLMGTLNVIGTWAFLKALEHLPGIVFFPMKAIFGVLLTALLAVMIWKENLTRRQKIGILIGGCAALLVNIKG